MQPFSFDRDVALNSLLYVASRVPTSDIYTVLKVIYFADKYHLENYGSFISGDKYIAMDKGPVPSSTYRIFQVVRDGDSGFDADAVEEFQEAINVKGRFDVVPLKDADFDYLSEAALESLNYSIKNFGHLRFGQLKRLSHDAAWKASNRDSSMDVEEIAKMFDEPDVLIDYLNDPYPG